jgi:hypothetical protein
MPIRVTTGLLIVLIGGCAPWYSRPCLSSDDSRTVSTRQVWAEANDETAPWTKRVCALESVSTHFNGYTDRVDEPQCRAELTYRLSRGLFDSIPIAYDRMQVARVVALAHVLDTTEVMARKADVLIRLAGLDDADIEDYRLGPDEVPPGPPKGWLRALALHVLASSNVFVNVPAAHQYELARRARPSGDLERRILYPALAEAFEQTLWGHPTHAVDNGSFALFDVMLGEIETTLREPYDPLSFDLLLDHLTLTGKYAKRFGRGPQSERLLRGIIDRRADLLACAGHAAACRDLYVSATLAMFDARSADWLPAMDRDRPIPEHVPLDWHHSVFETALYEHGVDCGRRLVAEPTDPVIVLQRTESLYRDGPRMLKDSDMVATHHAIAAAIDGDGPAVESAGRVLRATLEDVRRLLAANPAETQSGLQGIHMLGRYARALGLEDEVAPILAALASRSDVSPIYARAAVGARAALETSPPASLRLPATPGR